jgi:Tol biopolymer transport system component
MSKVDDELTRRLRRAERPVEGEGLFEGLAGRREHRERLRRVQGGLLAFAVLAATAGGFVTLRAAFDTGERNVGDEQRPSPFANGEIVFSAEGTDGYSHLYAMQPDGSERRQITDFGTNDTDPAVSPDGRTIAFVHQLEDVSPAIATIPIDGGTVTWLTDAELRVTHGPSWSPDGTRIVFAAEDGQMRRIYLMDADGSDLQPITGEDVIWPEDPAWSPDGTRIAFAASPSASREDGQPSRDIFTTDPQGREPVNVTNSSGALADEFGPTWSPDGERIAFARGNGEGSAIVVRRLPAGPETHVTDGSRIDVSPAWSPDGRLIVFDSHPLEGGGYDLWKVRPDGTASEQLTFEGGFGAAWQAVPAGTNEEPLSQNPSPSPEAEGRDIGLGFPLCHLERLEGILWYGDGRPGAAWTGVRLTDDGRCPSEGDGEYVVAADLDGDGTAEPGGMGFLEHCLLCRPFAATDLSGDGVLELIVLVEASSTPSYSIYEVSMPTSERSPGIYALSVAPPGAPEANLPANEPIRFSVGGDEGFSGGLRCENYPQAPVLVYTWLFGEVDAETDLEMHSTRLQLGEDGIFHVLETEDSTVPRNAETTGLISTEPACGVDFHPAA